MDAAPTFTYDADGNRITKTVNGVTTTYTYVDGRVTHETNGTDIIHTAMTPTARCCPSTSMNSYPTSADSFIHARMAFAVA